MKKFPEQNIVETPKHPAERPKYTLEDLERERNWDSGFGPNNPGAERRKLREHNARLKAIETYLIETGVLAKPPPIEKSPEEKLGEELDRLYPNAKSKTIVDYNGEKYQIRYYPRSKSNSGKTVHEWGHEWRLLKNSG